MKNDNTVYIGLGSNLQNPTNQIKQALRALDKLSATHLNSHSSLYSSKPLGSQNQPDYINAVAQLSTTLSPLSLLSKMQNIENKQGRVRTIERWGARTLDLDMLLYNNIQSQDPRLILPHPGIYERAFVLYPLYECAPDLVLPNGQTVYELKQRCLANGVIIDEKSHNT